MNLRFLKGLALFLPAPGALPAKRPVGPAPRMDPAAQHFRAPLLEMDVAALGPHAGLEHHRQADPADDDSAGAGQGTDEWSDQQQDYTDDENRPFDDWMVDKRPPLVTRNHRR